MNIVSDRDKFVWKGHERLTLRGGGESLEFAPGFQPSSLLQLHPPAAVTALAVHSQWGLLAVGTAHGLAVYDYIKNAPVAIKCTLNPHGKIFVRNKLLMTLIFPIPYDFV